MNYRERVTWRESTKIVGAGATEEMNFLDATRPNTFIVRNMSDVPVYIGLNRIPNQSNYEFRVDGNASNAFGQPVPVTTLFFNNPSNKEILLKIFSVNTVFDALLLKDFIGGGSQESEVFDGVIKGFTSALPAGNNKIGTVGIVGALPAGSNKIGMVGITQALPQGANKIGKIDVESLPVLPAGSNKIGTVGISGALPAGNNHIGNVSIDGGSVTINASLSPIQWLKSFKNDNFIAPVTIEMNSTANWIPTKILRIFTESGCSIVINTNAVTLLPNTDLRDIDISGVNSITCEGNSGGSDIYILYGGYINQ